MAAGAAFRAAGSGVAGCLIDGRKSNAHCKQRRTLVTTFVGPL